MASMRGLIEALLMLVWSGALFAGFFVARVLFDKLTLRWAPKYRPGCVGVLMWLCVWPVIPVFVLVYAGVRLENWSGLRVVPFSSSGPERCYGWPVGCD